MHVHVCVCERAQNPFSLPANQGFAEEGLRPPASATSSATIGVLMNVREWSERWGRRERAARSAVLQPQLQTDRQTHRQLTHTAVVLKK